MTKRENDSKNKFVIIDGNSLIYRAFHALPLLNTAKGEYTNGVFGFTKMLLKIIRDEQPDFLAVAFDKGKITFRHQQYSEYKGTRKATPEELKPQFEIVKEMLQAMAIPIFELEGYEADDLIGTLVRQGEKKGLVNFIVTGDKDALQLISKNVNVKLTRKGISEIEEYDLATLFDQYKLTPEQFIDLKGLMGDSSDNIPGVPGVGEKTGLKLLQEHGSLEKIIDSVEQIKGAKLQQKIQENAQLAKLSKELARIACDAPISIDCVDYFDKGKWNLEKLLELFNRLEFKSLLEELPINQEQEQEKKKIFQVNKIALTRDNFKLLTQELAQDNHLFMSVAVQDSILHIGLGAKQQVFYWEGKEPLDLLAEVLADSSINKYIHNSKEGILTLTKQGYELKGLKGDPMLQAYLLNPINSGDDIGSLSLEYLGSSWEQPQELDRLMLEKVILTKELVGILDKKLEEIELISLYTDVELPLSIILAKMELEGVTLDAKQLEQMSQELGAAIEILEQEIYDAAGCQFNINSPKQLGVVLFEQLGLPTLKKTKTGYSTNAEVLEALHDKHPIIAKLLDYRQLVKLKSTYVDGLQKLMDNSNRVHTTFNQTITATGRLSSTEPNLQNIPIRLEQGRRIRKAFIPQQAGRVLLAADYSQIELRVLAHISRDTKLIQAFVEGQDIHTKTACEVFEVCSEEVTSEMRRRAKAVNFGIVYGISDFGLSRDLGIQRGEAKRYIDNYLANYPGVKSYLEEIIKTARAKGYVTTILNRRRYLPDLHSRNKNIQNFGERTAMNTPIQGSAADIIKLAMINVEEAIQDSGVDCKMLLQVHDELIFDVAKENLDQSARLIKKIMEQVLTLEVPLQVDVKWGDKWYDMTPIVT